MLQHDNLTPIGQVAVFYLPSLKLYMSQYGRDYRMPKDMIHDFLIENYDAYTLETNDTHGFWRRDKTSGVVHDACARYEVSFGAKEKIPAFVDFLAEMCALMQEEAVYLTMGRHSYFVRPKGAA